MLKPRPNHDLYLRALQAMGPARRLDKAFELSEQARQLFFAGLKSRFPNLTGPELHDLAMGRLEKCHNRNY